VSAGERVEIRKGSLGHRILSALRPGCGVASLQIWVLAGSRAETLVPGSGTAHFLEHMVFKGTDRRSALEINRMAERLGGMLNAYTSYDRTVYHLDLPSENAAAGIDLLADFVWLPAFPPEGFEPERDVILREMEMVRDDPDDVLFHQVLREAYSEDLIRYPVIGDEEAFRKLSVRDLQAFHERHYRGGKTFWVMGGDLQEHDLLRAEQSISGLSVPAEPMAAQTGLLENPKPVRVRMKGNWEEGRGLALFPVRIEAPKQARLAEWAVETLSGGESGLLVRKLQKETEMVYRLDGFLYGMGPAALLGFSWLAASSDLPEVEEEFFKIMGKTGDFLKDDDLQRGWDRCRFQKLRECQSVDGWVSRLAEDFISFGRIYGVEEEPFLGPCPDRKDWEVFADDVLRPDNCMAGFLKCERTEVTRA